MNMFRQRGFTLTEIMVAIAIGLIGTIVIFKALQSTNIIAKSTTGGADSTTSGSIALYMMERDILQAGYGINDTNLIGCKVLMRHPSLTLPGDILANTATTGSAAFAPALVIGTAAEPTLRVAYAGGRSIAATKMIKAQSGTSDEIMRVMNLYGLQETGTVIMMGEANNGNALVTPPQGKPCTVAQTSQDLGPTDRDLMIVNTAQSPWSAPAGSGQTYLLEGRVYNLGSLSADNLPRPANIPVWKEYRVDLPTETLQERNLFTDDTFTTIAPNVTAMYVDYVMRDGSVRSSFPVLNPVGNVAADLPTLRNVAGLRVALLTRDAAPDYSRGSSCKNPADEDDENLITPQTSSTLFTGFKDSAGDDIRFTLSRTNNANAFCYRYKVVSTTVMMRNMLWSS